MAPKAYLALETANRGVGRRGGPRVDLTIERQPAARGVCAREYLPKDRVGLYADSTDNSIIHDGNGRVEN